MIKAICNADGKETEKQAAKKRAAGNRETERQTAKKRAADGRIRE